MKFQAWLASAAFFACLSTADSARARLRAQTAASGTALEAQAEMSKGKAAFQASIGSMVKEMLDGKGAGVRDIVRQADKSIELDDAVKQLDGQLPDDVASLVDMTGNKQQNSYDEDSLQKARRILNGMMLKGWEELDDVVFDAIEFSERNRGTFQQVVADLARLGSQLARLGELRVSSSAGIAEQDLARKEAEEILEQRKLQFEARRSVNQREMAIRKSDLAVFDFVLSLTACPSSSSSSSSSSGSSSSSSGSTDFIQLQAIKKAPVQICHTPKGLDLRFKNPALQAKAERLMTPEARLSLRRALGQIAPESFLQLGTTTVTSTTSWQNLAVEVQPVQEEPHPEGQWKKCVDTTDGCGPLHDLMSLEWGKFRDSFDELAADMKRNQDEYDHISGNINDQLVVINDEKTKHMEVLANTISTINERTEEMNEKDEQKRELTTEYDKEMAIYHSKVTEILYTKICALRRVRNELMTHSTTSPPSGITDCDFTDWESKSGECFAPSGNVILCDDTCPQADPNLCGGSETMKRETVVAPNTYGMVCPAKERRKKCAQRKCPVNCVMSDWSGWSKCTKECESGVELKTRSILTKPRNGGTVCDAVQEERSCNTGSCDRDCELKDWSDWSPCSVACNGGFNARKREVLVPIRGNGKCPKEKSRKRNDNDRCNTQDCVGDEICIAQQDLILALDASGSLKEAGYEIVRQFAVNITMKYQPEYFGIQAVKIGVILFGNGHVQTAADGTTTITPAINLQPLTSDFNQVRTAIQGSTYQRGFTNMAQALALADTMLSQGGRAEAQSAVMVISDGKYSFKYQTAQQARSLKDKNIMLYMVPITDFDGKDLRILKKWASQPWETNYQRIPGLAALKYNAEVFVQQVLVKFCPDAMSPSLLRQKEARKQFMLIHENGWPDNSCGQWQWVGKLASEDDCAAVARDRQQMAFSYGRTYAAGRCYTEAISISQSDFDAWTLDRVSPPCVNGNWLFNPFYDTYAINPSTVNV